MREPRTGAILLGVGAVAAALYFVRLGQAPFVDRPEGLHAAIAREMGTLGHWITPHFNGVRYFDKPPLLYWLMAAGFRWAGPSESAARFWSALSAFGTALLTAWLGTRITLSLVDLSSRNLEARGLSAPFIPYGDLRLLLARLGLIFGLASVAMAVAVWRRLPRFGLGVLLGVMVAFLPVRVEGLALFSKSRSVLQMVDLLKDATGPQDVVVHEGALENSGTLVLTLGRSVKIVDGRESSLAFGATFPEAREIFWDADRLKGAWSGTRRIFLVSFVGPERSVVRALPEGSVHLLLKSGGRWLYSNWPMAAKDQ